MGDINYKIVVKNMTESFIFTIRTSLLLVFCMNILGAVIYWISSNSYIIFSRETDWALLCFGVATVISFWILSFYNELNKLRNAWCCEFKYEVEKRQLELEIWSMFLLISTTVFILIKSNPDLAYTIYLRKGAFLLNLFIITYINKRMEQLGIIVQKNYLQSE